MAYASKDDIVAIYGEDILIAISDRAGTGEVDDDVVDAALATADSEINSYLATRYSVPLDPVPEYVRQLAVDIAVYRMAHEEAPRTVEMRLRYDDAVAFLKRVVDGKVNVPGLVEGGGGDEGEETPDVGSMAGIVNASRC